MDFFLGVEKWGEVSSSSFLGRGLDAILTGWMERWEGSSEYHLQRAFWTAACDVSRQGGTREKEGEGRTEVSDGQDIGSFHREDEEHLLSEEISLNSV